MTFDWNKIGHVTLFTCPITSWCGSGIGGGGGGSGGGSGSGAAADRVVTSFDGERDDAKAVTADCAEESSPDRRPGVCARFSSSIAKMKGRQERRRR